MPIFLFRTPPLLRLALVAQFFLKVITRPVEQELHLALLLALKKMAPIAITQEV
jgi:hypothetical protein